MNLIIDIGNTFTKTSVFKDDKEIFFQKTDTFSDHTIKELLLKFPDINACILSSVRNIKINVPAILKNRFYILNDYSNLPVKIKYKTPETLGKDRIAAVVGAQTIFPGKDILIIDAGTAITFDFIDKNGIFEGGNISPGLNTRLKSLHKFTGNLPLVEADSQYVLTGRTTQQAISSGVIFGMIYEIQGYIEEYQKIYDNLRIILTGGDANYFENKLKNSIFVILNINMIGLNRILKLYAAEN